MRKKERKFRFPHAAPSPPIFGHIYTHTHTTSHRDEDGKAFLCSCGLLAVGSLLHMYSKICTRPAQFSYILYNQRFSISGDHPLAKHHLVR